MSSHIGTTSSRGGQSRADYTSVHPRQYAEHHNHYSGHRRDRGNRGIWWGLQQMDWGEYPTFLTKFWRDCRYRLDIHDSYSRRSIYSRSNNQSSWSGRNNRYRKRNYYQRYYYITLCLLSIAFVSPVRAEEGETNNTSNPVAAATGNVTNQAVQFQNNGAPSRQQYGSGIVCNGATMTFSPFYMGNHTTPYDEHMDQQSYTVNENWGGQLNFMVPLDGSIVEQCKSIAARQEEKMRLDYELVRIKNCAELQQKGFTLRPGSRLEHICHDVVPISALTKKVEFSLDDVVPFSQPESEEVLEFGHTF